MYIAIVQMIVLLVLMFTSKAKCATLKINYFKPEEAR
jgi:hypothetical protein